MCMIIYMDTHHFEKELHKKMDFIHCNLFTEKNIVLPHINMSLPIKVTPMEIRSFSEK